MRQWEQISTIDHVIGRSLQMEEMSVNEVRRELDTLMPLTIANMLLDVWAAAVDQPAHVTSTVEKITGFPVRTFREGVVDHAAESVAMPRG